MDLRQMKYFLALAQELHFGRAAARLHMAQPPLTRQIRGLEDELGTPLFLRTAKGVELTAAGQALLDEVPNILSLTQRARDRTQQAGQGLIGQLDNDPRERAAGPQVDHTGNLARERIGEALNERHRLLP